MRPLQDSAFAAVMAILNRPQEGSALTPAGTAIEVRIAGGQISGRASASGFVE